VEGGKDGAVLGTLVDLSAGGFRMELPKAVGAGAPLHVTVLRNGAALLAFEGRLMWETRAAQGVLAGGDLLNMAPEDERILSALVGLRK
jgi:hypothetical protein